MFRSVSCTSPAYGEQAHELAKNAYGEQAHELSNNAFGGQQTRPHTLSGPHPIESGVTSSQRLSEAPILPTEGGHARRHIHIRSQIPEMPGSQIMVDNKVTELSLYDQEKNEDCLLYTSPSPRD